MVHEAECEGRPQAAFADARQSPRSLLLRLRASLGILFLLDQRFDQSDELRITAGRGAREAVLAIDDQGRRAIDTELRHDVA